MNEANHKLYGQLLDLSKLSGGVMLRGLLPFYVLQILSDQSMYGIQVIERIREMTKGHWKPSPGSIYPLLRKMAKLGFIAELDDTKTDPKENRRIYHGTDLGREALQDLRQEIIPRLKLTIELLTLHLHEVEK